MQKKDQLYRIAWSYLQNEFDVNDALQETVVKAFRGIVDLKNPEYFYTWYIRILINVCKDILRNKSNVIRFEPIIDAEDADSFGDMEKVMDLRTGMSKLSQEHNEVLFMRYMEDMSIKDIAKVLNLPEGTVKSRIHYGIDKLRLYMKERKVNKK